MLGLRRLRWGCLRQRCRNVSTWSPLAKAFNTPPYKKLNLTCSESGLFCMPELRSFEGFYFMRDNAAQKADSLISEAISGERNRKIVQVFDELSDTLCKVADLAEFIRVAHPQSKYSHAAEDACIAISGIVESLNTHKPLYKSLKNVVENNDNIPTTETDKHVAKLFLLDFEQSGIHLSEEDRRKVVRLNDYILQLGQRFMNGAVQPSLIPRSSVSDAIKDCFPTDGDNIIISGLYANSSNASAREAAYRLFLKPCERQEELLAELIQCRHALARICGFETYAHRALNASTVENPETVFSFLDILSDLLEPRALLDFEKMQKIKRQESGIPHINLQAWDTAYFTSQVKKKSLKASVDEFLPYFSLGGCMEGLDMLMSSLYGISFQHTKMLPGEAWHSDIYKLAVIHETEGLLGHIYCDFFERPGKPNQDCHFTIQGGKLLPDGNYQHPIVVIMLNLAQPRWTGPTLLSPARVDNLFHEMGHAMHSMLARTEYQHVTGTRCATDFAEVPSILMEYFASDARVLRKFAKHFQTHEPIPDKMLERLCASKNLFSASETQLQVFYSALDQVYHNCEQVEPDAEYFKQGHIEESYIHDITTVELKEPSVPLRVYTKYEPLIKFLTATQFILVDKPEDANILWLHEHFKNYEELAIQSPQKFINQFPFEYVITLKDLLPIVSRRSSKTGVISNTLDTSPSWLPTTYNLKTELVKFISYYQRRSANGLDNHWIIKPWNLARSLDQTITNNLKQIVRSSTTGPKIIQKYINNPVLFHRADLNVSVKFDVRYVFLLKRVQPLEAYIYKNFFLRFAREEFSLTDFENYEKHFTVMNYREDADETLLHIKCKDFLEQYWPKQYPTYSWNNIENDIINMLYDILICSLQKQPPCGITANPQSRALYAADIMLEWNNERIQPKILEINWAPDCKRACDYYEDFYNDIFKLLFLDIKNEDLFKVIQ